MIKIIFSTIGTVLLIGLLIFFGSLGYQNEEISNCTVEDKWIKRSGQDDVYLVQCDNEIYEISDLMFKGKFNSSDIYANLKVGNTYEITTTGYRVEFFSCYKNINEYKLIEGKDESI